MVDINLTTEIEETKEVLPYKKGIISIAIIMLVVAGVYGVLSYLMNNVSREKSAIDKQVSAENDKLLQNDESKSVVDFENRIALAKDLLSEKNSALESLPEVEKYVIQGVYLNSLIYNISKEGSTLGLDGVADSYFAVAKQIASLKKSEMFSDVSLGKTKLNDMGKIEFSLTLSVNDKPAS